MDKLKEKIDEIVNKIKTDKDFAAKFKENPLQALEDLSGLDIPEDKIADVITAIQAKVNIDMIDNALDKLKSFLK